MICFLVEQKSSSHIPYRDSKLTRLLEDSLGGNCKTTMMAMISPAFIAYNESISTLKFANRAKNIKNTPKINENIDSKGMIQRYELELKKLRGELVEKNKSSNRIQLKILQQTLTGTLRLRWNGRNFKSKRRKTRP